MTSPILKHLIEVVNEVVGYNCREKSQSPKYVEARWIYYKLAFNYTTASLTKVGNEVGLDHASVLNAIARVENPSYFNTVHKNIYETCDKLISRRYPKYKKIQVGEAQVKVKTLTKIQSLKKDNRKLEKRDEEVKKKLKELNKKLTASNLANRRLQDHNKAITESREKWKNKYLNK